MMASAPSAIDPNDSSSFGALDYSKVRLAIQIDESRGSVAYVVAPPDSVL
jgi:hypothetical protein